MTFDTGQKSPCPNGTMTKRYIAPQVRNDLTQKMVFLGGPRQVGKTFFPPTLKLKKTLPT